jgi:hypothetical protein
VVPSENAIRFYLALQKFDIPSELHIYQRGPHGVGLFKGDPILGTWSDHLFDWIRTNGFLAPKVERVAVEGKVILDGKPVSWGNVTFRPADPNLPETTLRIRNGGFKAGAENGPAIGESRLSISGSIWEATRDPGDRVIQLDPEPATLTVKAGLEPLNYDLKSR